MQLTVFEVLRMTINFLLNNINTQSSEEVVRIDEVISWEKMIELFIKINSLNLFFMEMYRHHFWEFVCGYWGSKGWQLVGGNCSHGSLYVSRKLPTYPSPKPKCWLRGGVGGSFPETCNDLSYLTMFSNSF